MIPTPTLYSLVLAVFVDNLAALPRGYFAKLAVTVTHMFGNNQIVILLYLYPVDIFCEIGLNSDRSVLTSLRSSLHTGTIFLFLEYIRKIRYLLTRLVTFNCILSHCDRGRSSRERGLQASPRLFSFGLFFGLFFFIFCIFCYHSLFGEWSAVQLPAKASDGHFASDFLLAAQLPATVSDGLSSSVFPFISLRLFSMLLSSTQAS